VSGGGGFVVLVVVVDQWWWWGGARSVSYLRLNAVTVSHTTTSTANNTRNDIQVAAWSSMTTWDFPALLAQVQRAPTLGAIKRWGVLL
jgi:hypothetical protein